MKKNQNRTPAWFMSTGRCPLSGLEVSHPESFACSVPESDFYLNIARLGRNMLLVKAYGYITSFVESEMQAFIDDFISRHIGIENKFVYLEDYGDITGGDAESRKKYISYFKNKSLLIAAIIYNLPPIYKISFNLFKKLNIYANRAYAVNSYEAAINLAIRLIDQNNAANTTKNRIDDHAVLASEIAGQAPDSSVGFTMSGFLHRVFTKIKGVNVFFIQKTRQQIRKEFSDELINFIAAIDWKTPGMKLSESDLYDDLSSKKVLDAINFVKSEIDLLMEERAASEEIVRKSEARYRLLVEHAKAGFMEYDYVTNRIISVNDGFIQMTGYSEQELLDMAPVNLLSEDSQEISKKRLSQIISGEPVSQDVVYECKRKNGDIWWALLNTNITYHNNRPKKGSVVVSDITKLKETEIKLLEYQEKLKRLSVRLSMIEEEQRRSMASHLHETIGQELFVMQMQLNAFEKSIDNIALIKALEPIKEQLLRIIKETKNLTFDLSPPVLYDFGFQEAVKTLAETIQLKNNICVQASFEGDMDAFADEIKVIVYRNIKELIHNSVKHADAGTITIRLRNSQGELHAELSDDGLGFDPCDYNHETSSHDGFGLFDIKEKMNHLGGSLMVDSAPGKGSVISMQVPLHLRN